MEFRRSVIYSIRLPGWSCHYGLFFTKAAAQTELNTWVTKRDDIEPYIREEHIVIDQDGNMYELGQQIRDVIL
jgi:hypothetical protein